MSGTLPTILRNFVQRRHAEIQQFIELLCRASASLVDENCSGCRHDVNEIQADNPSVMKAEVREQLVAQDSIAYSPKDVLYCSSSPQIFFAAARHRERGVGSRFRTSTRGLKASSITFSDSILYSYSGQLYHQEMDLRIL